MRKRNPTAWSLALTGVLFFVTLSTCFTAEAEESNLPAVGRSLFDHIVDGDGANIPYPFAELLAKVKQATQAWPGEAQNLMGSFLPFGRSLARQKTDLQSPRAVVFQSGNGYSAIRSPSELFNSARQGELYLGYSESTATVEVISYNRSAGRFEFQLIENYGLGLTPRLVYADRRLCLACHQSAGPIFPEGPHWRETDNNPAIARALTGANSFGLRSNGEFSSDQARQAVVNLDTQLDTQKRRKYAFDLWTNGCGKNLNQSLECKRLTLVALLSEAFFDEVDSATLSRLNSLYSATWPQNGVPAYRPQIPDVTATPRSVESSTIARLSPLTERQPETVALFEADALKGGSRLWLASVDNQFRLISSLGGFLLPQSEMDFLGNTLDKQSMVKAVRDGKVDAFLAADQPFDRFLLYRLLFTAVGVTAPPDGWSQREVAMAPARLNRSELDASQTNRGIHLFRTYCFACHSGLSDRRMSFMDAADYNQLLAQLRKFPGVLRRLRYDLVNETQQMPPVSSPQGHDLRTGNINDRLEMIQLITADSNQSNECAGLFKSNPH